jgi:transcriptional regulator of NAD metabolism
LAGRGDRIAVEGDLHGIVEFRIVRLSLKLRDPPSGEHLGDEVISLGKAVLRREGTGGVHNFIITSSTQEIMRGDLLIHDAASAENSTAVRSGAKVDAQIISIAGGVVHAAQNQIVGINKGARDNVVAGMSLALFATPEPHRAAAKNTQRQASGSPGNESGRLLIFRVYDRVSYGLITGSVEALQVGDKAFAPSTEYTPH